MDTDNADQRAKSEARIKALFEQCKVPEGNADKRVTAILKKGLYELSLKEWIDFSMKIFSTMCQLASAVDNPVSKGNRQ